MIVDMILFTEKDALSVVSMFRGVAVRWWSSAAATCIGLWGLYPIRTGAAGPNTDKENALSVNWSFPLSGGAKPGSDNTTRKNPGRARGTSGQELPATVCACQWFTVQTTRATV